MYTEFVSADGLIRDAAKSLRKLEIADFERPVGIQIYGKDPMALVEAAKRCEEAQPDLIDLNFGCPVKKIAGKGAGAGLLQDIPLMLEITRKVVDAVKLPVTVKTRLGWDENSKPIVELAEQLQDCGIAALTVHGRTRSQMYKGEADWTLIGEIKNNQRMHIPIIGNGDVTSPEIAKQKFDAYGVDAIMIGRAAIGKPWLFKEVKHYLQTGELLPAITVLEKVELAKRHLKYSLDWKGPVVGVFEMRQHFSNYFKALPDFKSTRIRLVTESNPEILVQILNEVAEKWGEK
jgi:nifR3 family TIM-barrel protein